MNPIAFVLAVGIICLVLLFLAFRLDNNEHKTLKFLCIFFFIGLLVLIPKAIIDDKDNCSFEINTTTVNATTNTTSYTYDYFCSDSTNTTAVTFWRAIMLIIAIVSGYFIIYIFWKLFKRDSYDPKKW